MGKLDKGHLNSPSSTSRLQAACITLLSCISTPSDRRNLSMDRLLNDVDVLPLMSCRRPFEVRLAGKREPGC